MKINSTWVIQNFKQKYYLFCPETKLNLIRFASVENKSHICRVTIKEL